MTRDDARTRELVDELAEEMGISVSAFSGGELGHAIAMLHAVVEQRLAEARRQAPSGGRQKAIRKWQALRRNVSSVAVCHLIVAGEDVRGGKRVLH